MRITVEGREFWLCENHFRLVVARLRDLCRRRGRASLADLEVRLRGGRIAQMRTRPV